MEEQWSPEVNPRFTFETALTKCSTALPCRAEDDDDGAEAELGVGDCDRVEVDTGLAV